MEGDRISASGKIRYGDPAIGSQKTMVAEEIEITGADRDNYILSTDSATADIGIIGKRAYPLNIPQNRIAAANSVKKASEALILPDAWEWQNEDGDKEIPAGKSIVVTAEYTGDDKEIYQTTSVAVTITREACTEDMAVRFDGDGDYEPTCIEQGKGHTICSVCGNVTSPPNPSDHGDTTQTPSPSQDSGDADKGKTEGMERMQMQGKIKRILDRGSQMQRMETVRKISHS